MSVNNFRPHLLVLPEDDANRQLANGFLLDETLDLRAIQLLPNAGGWAKVRDVFKTVHAKELSNYGTRYMVLLVDFDEEARRGDQLRAVVPQDLTERVFVLGVWSEPEDLKRAGLGSLETVGRELARECRGGSRTLWNHRLLQHNATVLDRLTQIVRPFLFPAS